jgi:hypothetical protein
MAVPENYDPVWGVRPVPERWDIDANFFADNETLARFYPLGWEGGIGIYDNYVSREHCAEIMQTLNLNWKRLVDEGKIWRGVTVGGVMPGVKNTWDTRIETGIMGEDIALANGWHEMDIANALGGIINEYTLNFHQMQSNLAPLRDSSYQVQTYLKGEGFYDEHYDGGPYMPVAHRYVTIILYLNDVEVGGATYFPNQKVAVNPKAGRVVIFPSNHLFPHLGEVPLSGNKTIISTFIENQQMGDFMTSKNQEWQKHHMDLSDDSFGGPELRKQIEEYDAEDIEVFNEF